MVAAARLELLALVVLNFGVERLLGAYRLLVLLRVAPKPPAYWKILRAILVSHFLGFFLPGSAGIDLVLMHSLSRSTLSLWLAVSAVLVERTLGFLAVIMLVLLGVALSSQELPSAIARTAALALVAVVVATIALMHWRCRALFLRLVRPQALAPLANAARSLFERLDAFAGRLPLLAWSVLLAIGFQLLRVSHVAIASWGFGANSSVLDFLIIVPVAFFAQPAADHDRRPWGCARSTYVLSFRAFRRRRRDRHLGGALPPDREPALSGSRRGPLHDGHRGARRTFPPRTQTLSHTTLILALSRGRPPPRKETSVRAEPLLPERAASSVDTSFVSFRNGVGTSRPWPATATGRGRSLPG